MIRNLQLAQKKWDRALSSGGENYGQGSSREHAAINPMYLGVKAVIAKSIARIHKGNLVNHGVIPMLFEDGADYDRLEQTDDFISITCGSRLQHAVYRLPIRQKDVPSGLN